MKFHCSESCPNNCTIHDTFEYYAGRSKGYKKNKLLMINCQRGIKIHIAIVIEGLFRVFHVDLISLNDSLLFKSKLSMEYLVSMGMHK